jgi:iron(III) transport system permease protein
MADSGVVGLVAGLIAIFFAAGLAFLTERTNLRIRSFVTIGLWAILLAPTYLVAIGWEELVIKGGLLDSLSIWHPIFQQLILGPVGVALILGLKGVPFAYFAFAPSLAAIGGDLESAIRIHGGRRRDSIRLLTPLLLPSLLSGFIIVFAESIGDFGVAATIAASAHFPIATYFLYQAISTFPANFGVAAVVGWGLVLSVAAALLLQGTLLRKRNYAVIGGRNRSSSRIRLSRPGQLFGSAGVVLFFLIELGLPMVGVIISSILTPFEGFKLSAFTLSNYRDLLGVTGLGGPIRFSAEMATICGLGVVMIGAVLARTMTSRRSGIGSRLLDLTLVGAVALPGVVFAAGYIFVADLPVITHLGIALYGTTLLLGIAYTANSVPQSSRLLFGPFSQLKGQLVQSARVHGATNIRAWKSCALPLLARPILWAFLLAFAGIFLELPISELLAPPNVVPVSVAVLTVLGKANIGEGTALSVVAVLLVLSVVAIAQGLFRLLAPLGWRIWHEQRSQAPTTVAEVDAENFEELASTRAS